MPSKPINIIAVSLNTARDLKTDDHRKAVDFLWGRGVNSGKHPNLIVRRIYPQQQDERIAREALLRVLRSQDPLPPTIRKHLAELFDPASKYERKLEFGFRKKGRRAGASTTREIGLFFEKGKGIKNRKSLMDEAMERFNLQQRMIANHLKKYKDSK